MHSTVGIEMMMAQKYQLIPWYSTISTGKSVSLCQIPSCQHLAHFCAHLSCVVRFGDLEHFRLCSSLTLNCLLQTIYIY